VAVGLLEGGVAGALPATAERLVAMAREGAERLSQRCAAGTHGALEQEAIRLPLLAAAWRRMGGGSGGGGGGEGE
jgi:hypothetical protein